MFRKAKSATEDSRVRPLQRLAVTQPAAAMLHPSETVSSIGSEMAVIGKINCKGALKIYGLVEGEVIASNAFIADGARIQGDIVAEELTIAGRVKGNIHALRVKLQATAVVEGDISHRSLSIDEHACFEGRSAPEDNPPEQRSSAEVESSTPQPWPQALVAFDDQSEFKADSTEEDPTWLRHTGMNAFLPACIAIISIGVVSYFALNALQQPRYTIDNVRIDPGWIERSTQLGSTGPLSGLESAAVRAPETPQVAPVVQNAPETNAPKARDASLDPERAIAAQASTPETPQVAPVVQNAPETIPPKARGASLDPERTTAARASTPETPQAAPVVQNAPETIAPKARDAPLEAKMASEDAKLQAIDVEVVANVPVPRPRPTAASGRKSMPVLERSARAPTAPQWLRALISPN
jgi:cytoskeletal protein CcmA (bactofilin family)